ncbi:MAG: aminopeptidase N [Nitriliruptorales bacterium]
MSSLPGGNLTRAEATERSRLVSEPAYEVSLDLTGEDQETFRSTTVLRFLAAPGAGTFLDLSARSVDRIELNGRTLSDVFDGTRVHLPPLSEQNEVVVEATCEYQSSGVGMHHSVDPTDGAVYLHTQFEPFDAHRVFACFDQPDLKATFEVRVDAPEDWEVVSNTVPTTRGGGRWEFAQTPLLATYLVAVVAGPYARFEDEHGGVPLGMYCRRSLARHLDTDELFDLTRRGLDWFAETFDYPYPFGKYDQLFVPEFNSGAMENPGCVTFSEHYVFRGQVTEAERASRANTLLHEMAHMWFGDLVTMRWWDDLWLNESFATFMATLASERATRFTNAWVTFADEKKAWARRQDQLPTTHPISTDASDIETVMQNFDGITYAKGASVLRQLVAWVGEGEFLEGCRRYFRRFAYGNAELRDLLSELEGTSGRDLQSWAKEWLQTAGMNALAPEVTSEDGTCTSFALVQTAPDAWPTLRPHRVAVGVYDQRDGFLSRRARVELDVVGGHTEVPELVGEPAGGLVLVNDGDLAFLKMRLDGGSLATATGHLSILDDPLARTLVWGATWDMVRDAELPARAFVALARNNVGAETDVGVLQTVNARSRTAALLYGDPANAETLGAALAGDAREATETADPGSDLQLAWARQWIAAATTPEQLRQVRALLDGDLVFDGLKVDTELRWQIVGALAGAGAVGTDVIDAELERDPTDLGERRAAGARAARPEPAAKEEAWERIVGDTDLSHAMMKALMGGFVQRDQPDLLRPYVERYFDALDRVWEERQLEIALAFTGRMYPTPVVEEATLERTDRELARSEIPSPLRRALLEERDTVERALHARALDSTRS